MNTKFRKVVRGMFTGADFEIARVSMKRFMEEMGDLPISIAAAVRKEMDLEKQVEKMSTAQQAELNLRSEQCMLRYGVQRIRFSETEEWSPVQFWFGEQRSCPPDFIMATDLGGDFDLLVQEIIQLSFHLEGVGALERFFRGAGSVDAGSGSEALRSETVADASARNSAA